MDVATSVERVLSDHEIPGSNPAHCPCPSAWSIYPQLLLSTQVYKWGPVGGESLYVNDLLEPTERLEGILPREWRWCTQCVLVCIVSYDRGNNKIVKRIDQLLIGNALYKYQLLLLLLLLLLLWEWWCW